MDINLIKAARSGDLGAWEHLLRKMYPQALGHASYLLRDKDLAGDAVQNAMLKVFNNLSRLKDDGAFNAWWRRILMNEIYLLLRFSSKETPDFQQEFLSQNGPSVEDYVALKLELSQAIKRLPLEQQQAVLDIDLRGLELKEAADDYNIPLGTVKSRLFRARARLQESLLDYTCKAKEKTVMSINNLDLSNKIYDYLEGTMDAGDRKAFEQDLEQNQEWKQQLKSQKDFLTLLHLITGKIALSAGEVQEKVQAVIDKIADYEEIVDDISFENGNPTTMTSHIWFKRPELYRTDGSSPLTGPITIIVKDNFLLSWAAETKQAKKVKLSQEYRERTNLSFPDRLKAMAENKSSRILGTEYLQGRPTLHVQFAEKVQGLGEMNTHLWMDKETWMPILTEYYNVNGQLVNRREVRELRINQGLPDTLFELNLPEDVQIEEENGRQVNFPQEISLEKAGEILAYSPYIMSNKNLKAKHQWVEINDDQGILISNYTVLGEQQPWLVVTQGPMPHANIPPKTTKEIVELEFAGSKVKGDLIKLEIGGVKYILTWQHKDVYMTCGGLLEKSELLKIPEKLVQTNNP